MEQSIHAKERKLSGYLKILLVPLGLTHLAESGILRQMAEINTAEWFHPANWDSVYNHLNQVSYETNRMDFDEYLCI